MPAVTRDKDEDEQDDAQVCGCSPSETHQPCCRDHPCIAWSGLSKAIPVLLFIPEAVVSKDGNICSVGERYNLAFKIVRTESRLVRSILTNHGFHEVHPNSNDFNLMWTGSHLKPYVLRSLQDFQKVNHFPRSYELTRKDRLYKNILRMQQTHGFKNFHIVPQTFVLPSEYQEFCNCFTKDKGPWIIKPVASSRGRGIYLVSNPNQISMDENILVSRYIHNPLLIDEFKFDVRLYVLVTSYDPLIIYVYEEGLARFATVKYDQTSKNIKNTFMHLTNYSVNKKSSDYVSCDDPEVEDYGNKWSMSAVLRYLKQEGKDTTLLMRQVEDLIIKALLSAELQIATACKTFVPHKTNCFELYGFDVLIDSHLKPWLLEVNLSPSLACDAPLDLKIKASMIADMFSLVGFVCQDPLSRQPCSDRVTLDPSLKHPATHRTQRPASVGNSETEGPKDKQGAKQSQGDSTLSLTTEEIKVLRRIKEEYERRGGFVRIFPTAETWELYGGYLESKSSMNIMLANRLFHGRNVNVQLQEDAVHDCHVVQYERKLLSLEARKRRGRHLPHRSAAGRKKSGKESKASPSESNSQEGEECAQEEGEEVKRGLEPVTHMSLAAEQRKEEAGAHKARPKVNLLNILQQGWDLSKVQARLAFSSYLKRVQQRLLAESTANTTPAWPEKDNDQMELVIRFLRMAASNLQEDIKVIFPSRRLPLQDRRRILSFQLGRFIHCYNKETEHMVNNQESSKDGNCVNSSVFQEYIDVASENDLEEVLTFYTQKNKSATVFLGTKIKGVKKDADEIKAPRASAISESSRTLPVARDDSSASESSLSTGKVSSDPDVKATETQPSFRMLPKDQQAVIRTGKSQPQIQASQHCSGFPVTLDCTNIHLQHCLSTPASLPLHCPPPPPPQPPSYVQSLTKSHFCHSETLSDPPAYTSGPVVQQPPRLWTVSTGFNTISTGQPAQMLRRVQSFTSTTSASGAPSSMPSATHIYSQKLSRPTSAGQVNRRSSSSKQKSTSAGGFKELNSLSAKAQSNQQSFISALQKLADKQVARHSASSSHINLLTQHLSNLNLANKMLNRESFTLNPRMRQTAATTQGPVKTVPSGSDLQSSSGHRPLKGEQGTWEKQMHNTCSSVAGLNPQQRYQPSQGSYQLQFAIHQLQQQKAQSRQFMDQSHGRHQVQFPDQTCASHTGAATHPSSYVLRPGHSHFQSHIQTCVSPVLTPKPPSSVREGKTRKTATKRLIKQTSSESSASGAVSSGAVSSGAVSSGTVSSGTVSSGTVSSGTVSSGAVSSGQHMVYEAICGKTGLSVYRKLFQGQEPSRR